MNTKQLIRIFSIVFLLYTLHITHYTSVVYPATKGNPPVAHWRFDDAGGPTAYDESTNNNDGTLTAGALGSQTAAGQMWYPQGKIGAALEFDGTDDWVSTSLSVAQASSANTATYMAWVYPTSNDGTRRHVISTDNGGYDWSLLMETNWHVFTNAASWNTGVAVNLNTWQHIAVVFSATDIVFYKNGVPTSMGAAPSYDASTNTVGIGKSPGYPEYFPGLIDDVRIYNYARTADQIMVDYNAGAAAYLGGGTDPNEGNPPVGWWQMDEGSGTNAYDRSGSNNNGTITGATWAAGKYGSALSFDGNDIVTLPDSAIAFDDFTIEVWTKDNTSASGVRPIISFSDAGTPYRIVQIQRDDGSTIRFTPKYYNPGYTNYYYRTIPESSEWYHLAMVVSGTTATFYHNGVQSGSSQTGIYDASMTPVTGRIGRGSPSWYDGYYFNGNIDEARVYNYARTQAQITYDYNKGKPVAHYKFDEGGGVIANNEYSQAGSGGAAPVGWWRMDEASSGAANGATIVDQSGYGNNGTASYGANLTGMTWTIGKIGPGTLSFDGVDDVVNCGTPASLDITGTGITYEAWVYHTFTPGSHTYVNIIRKHWSSGNWIRFEQNVETPNFNLYGVGNVNANTTLSPNTWYHIAGTYDGSNMKIYIDGVLKNSTAATASITSSAADSFYIGAGAPASEPWKGYIDDVRVYNYARTAEQIYNDYKNTHGTLVGDTKFVAGKLGKALSFDGTGDYVILTDNSSLDITADFAISAWVKTSQAFGTIYSKTNPTTPWAGYIFSVGPDSGGKLALWTGDGGWDNSNSTVNDNNWHHVAVVLSGTTATFYKDGVSDGSVTVGVPATNSQIAQIGKEQATTRYFSGLLDDVRVYKYARTADRVMQDYNAGASAHLGAPAVYEIDPWAGAAPVAWWMFDENSGMKAYDASGNGKDGTLTTGPTWVQGKVGPALSFDGTDDYVNMGSPTNLGLSGDTAFTIEAWINPSSTRLDGAHVSYGNAGANQVVSLVAAGSNKIYSVHYSNDYQFNTTFALNQWQHVTITYDPTTSTEKLYVNGIYTGESWSPVNLNIQAGHALNIGRATWNGTIVGACKIDDIRIYNYARTQAQIAWDYNRGKPIAHWKMDEAVTGAANGQTIYDESDNNSDGTANYGANLTGMTWATGKFGGALSFDGVDDVVNCGNNASLNFTSGDFTISVWIKTTDSGGTIVERGLSQTDGYTLMFDPYVHLLTHQVGAYTYVRSQNTANSGNWEHWVAVREGTNARLYRNGVENVPYTGGSPTAIANAVTSTRSLTIGTGNSWGLTNGLIDDVRIYNYARTAAQIMQDYNEGAAARLGD